MILSARPQEMREALSRRENRAFDMAELRDPITDGAMHILHQRLYLGAQHKATHEFTGHTGDMSAVVQNQARHRCAHAERQRRYQTT